MARYGNFVTYNPPLTVSTAVLWVAPISIVLFGFGFIVTRSRRKSVNKTVSSEMLDENQEQRLKELLEEASSGSNEKKDTDSMMAFWIGTALLLVVSCILIVYPLLNPKEVDEATQRDDLNKAFYKDRLAELESEDQAGIVGNKSDLVTDLKQLLLDDIPDSKSDAKVECRESKMDDHPGDSVYGYPFLRYVCHVWSSK